MKIVEAFLFSEAHEADILLLKFTLSHKKVDAWVICENAYSHQGDNKGLNARKIIKEDPRFEPFVSKIYYLEGERLFHVIDKTRQQDNLAFECENWQRQLAYGFFLDNFADEDWLVLHDVDEMFDFTDDNRIREFDKQFKHNTTGIITVPRMRYWYDFDNLYPRLYSSVLVSKKYLLDHPIHSLSYLRSKYSVGKYTKHQKTIIVFEYSSCFNMDNLVRKLDTNPHTGISKTDLLQALRCNHRTIPAQQLQKKLSRQDFFESVLLNEANAPLFVRQNLQSLKTHIVDVVYAENRRTDYPHLFTKKYVLFYHPLKTILNQIVALKKKVRKVWMYAYMKSIKIYAK